MIPAKPRKEQWSLEVAWDIETVNWNTVVAVCGVASNGERIQASSFEEYVSKAEKLGWFKSTVRHWAHFGGIFDHLFALEHCSKTWILHEARGGSGFGVWSADLIKRGAMWRMRDSGRLFPLGLAKVGVAFGLEKLEVDRSNIHLLTQRELFEYCMRDCDVLLHAILKFKAYIQESDGVLGDTIAGTASRIIRQTLPRDCWGWNINVDERVACAYYGARTERFMSAIGPGRIYDINSSYPAQMVKPLPTEYVGTSQKPRDSLWWAALAVVEVPAMHLPMLPFRTDKGPCKGKLLFPVGNWVGWYAKEELQALESVGGKYRIIEAMEYREEPWLKATIEKWWNTRKNSSDKGIKLITKLLMNCVYGKTIERGEYETIVENPTRAYGASTSGLKVRLYNAGDVPLYGITERHNGTLRHAATAAAILARSRLALWDGMREASKTGDVAYCDTDSVITTGTLPSSEELGAFKQELEFECGEFLAPKVYAVSTPEGKIKACAKGLRFPRVGPEDSPEQNLSNIKTWARVSYGEKLCWETHVSFKRGLNQGTLCYRRTTDSRQFHGGVDKRNFSGDTSTPYIVKNGVLHAGENTIR